MNASTQSELCLYDQTCTVVNVAYRVRSFLEF